MASGTLESEAGEEAVPPTLSLFFLAVVSMVVPIVSGALSSAAASLVGYVLVLVVTVPSALAFKAQGMRAEALGATFSTYPKLCRSVQWIVGLSTVAAIFCAVRFALAIS